MINGVNRLNRWATNLTGRVFKIWLYLKHLLNSSLVTFGNTGQR